MSAARTHLHAYGKGAPLLLFLTALLLAAVPMARATSNYDYKKDEYLPISNGTSPDKKWTIKAHGDGDLGSPTSTFIWRMTPPGKLSDLSLRSWTPSIQELRHLRPAGRKTRKPS